MKNSVDLTQGNLVRHILRLLVPSSVAMFALLSGGLIDTFYLGRLSDPNIPNLGVLALAAIGFGFPLTLCGNSANIGLGAGTLSAVSRAIGQGEPERARRHGAAAILLGLSTMAVLVTVMLLTMPMILKVMGAEGQIYSMAANYLMITLPGLAFITITVMCVNVLRARGEAALPSSFLITSAIVNIVLDPFLIFGIGPFPRLEIEGAAFATVIGHAVGASLALYFVLFNRKAITFAKMSLGSIRRAWGVIGRVGVPAAGTRVIVPIGATMAVAIIARFLTTEDVAAFTIAGRIEILSIAVLYALSGCIGAIVGQNGGAGLTDRVRATFKYCYIACCIWGLFITFVMAIFATQIAGAFSLDPTVISKTKLYFYIVPLTIFAYGIVFVSSSGFNALGRPLYGLTYTIFRSLLLYVGFIYIGVQYDGLGGAFLGIAAANIISGLIAFGWTLYRAPLTARTS
ncbi:MAG: MATE family efflux transporter [Hellea sp.]